MVPPATPPPVGPRFSMLATPPPPLSAISPHAAAIQDGFHAAAVENSAHAAAIDKSAHAAAIQGGVRAAAIQSSLNERAPPSAEISTHQLHRKCSQVLDYIRSSSPERVPPLPPSPQMVMCAAELDASARDREAHEYETQRARYEEQRRMIQTATCQSRALLSGLPFMTATSPPQEVLKSD